MPAALPATPSLGQPVPDVPHAVSVQLPTWNDIKEMFTGAARVKQVQQTGYPRSFIHEDIKQLNQLCVEKFAPPSVACFIFADRRYAIECQKFATTPSPGKQDPVAPHLTSIRAIEVVLDHATYEDCTHDSIMNLYAVFCPQGQSQLFSEFWRLVGTGISSRLAEHCVKHMDVLQDVTGTVQERPLVSRWRDPSYRKICQRIVDFSSRAPVGEESREVVARDDVYLYQTGMAAIYHAQDLLNHCYGGESVMFGFPYELTLKLLETYGPPVKFYPFGSDEELDQLETFLTTSRQSGKPVQAIWCECASNPLLRTPDLRKLRALANKEKVAIVVDDTIGSFANVDLTDVADIVVTSLTKSFSGFADVMGGSLVLNPASPLYSVLKAALDATYTNCVFERDTAQLELNSRDFLSRVSRMNNTASYLVKSLRPLIADPESVLTALYYPEICWSTANYRAQMRQPTKHFTPGYGGLFAMEFEDVEVASVFFNALNVHKGPSLGASVTLAQPYVQTVFYKQKAWAGKCGLHESIVRVSVGLEDKEALLMAFMHALSKADERKRSLGTVKVNGVEKKAPMIKV